MVAEEPIACPPYQRAMLLDDLLPISHVGLPAIRERLQPNSRRQTAVYYTGFVKKLESARAGRPIGAGIPDTMDDFFRKRLLILPLGEAVYLVKAT